MCIELGVKVYALYADIIFLGMFMATKLTMGHRDIPLYNCHGIGGHDDITIDQSVTRGVIALNYMYQYK